jgi:hypothetical protein
MNYVEKVMTTLRALHDLHHPPLEPCRNPEEVSPLLEEVRLSDPSRNYHSTDLPRQCMTMDDEADKAKAAYLNMTTFLLRSSGLPVKDRISETWVP